MMTYLLFFFLLSCVRGDPCEEFENNDYSKSIRIINSCSFDISIGVTGGYSGTYENEKCPGRNQLNNGDMCFHTLKDHPKELESGESWYVEITPDSDQEQIVTSGNVWATKTDMYDFSCYQGECKPWVGATGPVTKAEFTLVRDGLDYYDISTIEGANLPVSMYPLNTETSESDIFFCGKAGSCKWEYYVDDNEIYLLVSDGSGEECTSHSECDEDEICGTSFSNEYRVGVCGKHVGFSSAHLHCNAGSKGYPFICDDFHDVISCKGDYNLSGYSQKTGKVCGCMDDVEFEKFHIDAQGSIECVNKDNTWMERSFPFLVYLKRGCPDSYSYAYDDHTSTYICPNPKDYIIEFCPDDSESNFFI